MAVGNGYSSAQILSMQKDAMRRVNEMQRTAQEKLRQTQETLGDGRQAAPVQGGHMQTHTVPQPVEVRHSGEASHLRQAHEPESRHSSPPAPADGGVQHHGSSGPPVPAGGPPVPDNPLQGILSRLNLDGETVLLLLMLLLLVNEGADSKLIMALVYILL